MAGTRERWMNPRPRGGRDAASAFTLTKQSLDTACATDDFCCLMSARSLSWLSVLASGGV
jgi:hypothetical protein